MIFYQVFKNLREDGKDCTSLYTDPHYFGRVWFNQMQKEFEANKRVSYRLHRFSFINSIYNFIYNSIFIMSDLQLFPFFYSSVFNFSLGMGLFYINRIFRLSNRFGKISNSNIFYLHIF